MLQFAGRQRVTKVMSFKSRMQECSTTWGSSHTMNISVIHCDLGKWNPNMNTLGACCISLSKTVLCANLWRTTKGQEERLGLQIFFLTTEVVVITCKVMLFKCCFQKQTLASYLSCMHSIINSLHIPLMVYLLHKLSTDLTFFHCGAGSSSAYSFLNRRLCTFIGRGVESLSYCFQNLVSGQTIRHIVRNVYMLTDLVLHDDYLVLW